MASKVDARIQEELIEEATRDTTLNRRPSNELEAKNVYPDYYGSSPAILQLSDDEPLFKRETIRKPFKNYKAIMKSFNSTEIYRNSEELLIDGESGQLTDGSRSRCFVLFNRYKNCVIKFRKSKLFYILQILWILLPFFEAAMGIKYADCCPGSPSLTFLTLLTGMMGIILIVQWMAIQCCQPHERPCEGQQKFTILFLFILVAAMLELEIYLFIKLPLSFEPSATNYCSKIFYDYTYYKFIGAFGSMFLVTLLYLPSYQDLASGVVCSDPLAASCYKDQLLEDDQ